MRKYIVLLILGCKMFCFQLAGQKQVVVDSAMLKATKNVMNHKMPSFIINTDSGKISERSYIGKITLVNVFAIGCLPCMAEIHALNEIQDSLKHSTDFAMIAFCLGKRISPKEMLVNYGINYPVVFLAMDSCNMLTDNVGFPTTYILDREGIIKYCKFGGMADSVKARNDLMRELYPALRQMLQVR